VTGDRLVDFDLNVVAPNAGCHFYNGSTGTCALSAMKWHIIRTALSERNAA